MFMTNEGFAVFALIPKSTLTSKKERLKPSSSTFDGTLN